VLARAARRVALRGELPRDVALEPQQVRVHRRLGRLERAPLARAGVGRGRRRARTRRVKQAQQRGRLRGHMRVAGPTRRVAWVGCVVACLCGGAVSLESSALYPPCGVGVWLALCLSCTATTGGVCASEGTRDMHACCQARPGGSLGSKRAISLRASSERTGVPQPRRMHLQRRRAIGRQRHQAWGHVRGAAGR